MKLRMCEVVLYQEQYAKIQDIEEICKQYNSIKKYAIILHDKDVLEDGTLKKPHYHMVLHFGVAFDVRNLTIWFDIHINYINKIKGRWHNVLRYLTHDNAKEKYQYSKDDILSNFDVEEEISKGNRDEDIKKLIIDYSNLDLTYYNLWEAITPEERLKYIKSIDSAIKIRDTNIKLRGNRDMEVYYITGKAGSGKTTFAKFMAEEIYKMSYYISSSSNDPLQDYLGQEIIILDDLRADSFTFTDLLKLLDNHTNSSVKSRYYNKNIDCKKIIITSIKQVWELYPNQVDEPMYQLIRRVKEFAHIDDKGKIWTKQVDIGLYEQTRQIKWVDLKVINIPISEVISKFKKANVIRETLEDAVNRYRDIKVKSV